MLAKTFLFIAAIFALATAAQAAPECSAEFRAAAQKIPLTLIGMGQTHYGRLNLQKLVADIANPNNVNVVSGSGKDLARRNGVGKFISDRTTGRWETRGGRRNISVDCGWWNKYPEQKSAFALHEFLGALGFVDSEYSISMTMWFLTKSDAQKLLHADEKNKIAGWLTQNTNLAMNNGGGVVGIGGGGEATNVWARAFILTKNLNALKAARDRASREEAVSDIFHTITANFEYSVRHYD